MQSFKYLASAAILGLTVSGTSVAQDDAPVVNPADNAWVGTVGAGLVLTGGNTENQSGHGLLDLTRNIGAWGHNISTAVLWTADSERTTAEKYFMALQSNRSLSERSYLLGYASYDKDRFSGFDYQATAALGYGYRVIVSEPMNLTVEAGPGYRVSSPFDYRRVNAVDFADAANRPELAGLNIGDIYPEPANGYPVKLGTLGSDGEVILRLAEAFDWKFSEGAKLFQELNIEAGSDNTTTRFLVGVETSLIGGVAMRVSYGFKNNSDVPQGVKKTDTETAVTLAYSF